MECDSCTSPEGVVGGRGQRAVAAGRGQDAAVGAPSRPHRAPPSAFVSSSVGRGCAAGGGWPSTFACADRCAVKPRHVGASWDADCPDEGAFALPCFSTPPPPLRRHNHQNSPGIRRCGSYPALCPSRPFVVAEGLLREIHLRYDLDVQRSRLTTTTTGCGTYDSRLVFLSRRALCDCRHLAPRSVDKKSSPALQRAVQLF